MLGSIVEIDATYIGGKEKNKHSNKKQRNDRGTASKQGVIGIRERDGSVSAFTIPNSSHEVLHGVVYNNVTAGTTVYTDDFRLYIGLSADYTHETVCHNVGECVRGMAHTNSIESVWSVLKREFNSVYHKISFKPLNRYLNDFTFRLNDGNVKAHTMDKLDAMASGMFGKRVIYKGLVNEA